MLRVFVLMALSFALSQAALGEKSEKTEAQAANCEKVAKFSLPNATVTSAEVVAPGSFRPSSSVMPWAAQADALYRSLPAFCRVRIDSHPSSDSDIKIEVWLPLKGWNGKLQGRGNGGFAGEIDDFSLALALHEGYATAGTDTGHAASGVDARWALGHPEKVIDFGYRAIHEMTQDAKLVVKQFYGKHPLQHAYFASCSNGGRQALMEAQRLPRRLRRNYRGRACELLDASGDERHLAVAGDDVGFRPATFHRRSCRRLRRPSTPHATRKTGQQTEFWTIRENAASIPRRCCAKRTTQTLV